MQTFNPIYAGALNAGHIGQTLRFQNEHGDEIWETLLGVEHDSRNTQVHIDRNRYGLNGGWHTLRHLEAVFIVGVD